MAELKPIIINREDRVEIGVPSLGRNVNLAVLLQSLRTQVFQNWDLTIIDDNDEGSGHEIKNDFTISAIIKILEMEGHRVRIIKGVKKGPIYTQNIMLMSCKKKLLIRMDDDLIPEKDFFIKFMRHAWADNSGMLAGVGGVYPELDSNSIKDYMVPSEEELAKYEAFECPEYRYIHPPESRPREVTSLYSSFLLKPDFFKAAGGYSLSYSVVAEKEEPDACIRVASLGAHFIFEPSAKAWHLKAPSGGIRSYDAKERKRFFFKDYNNFVKRAQLLSDGDLDLDQEREVNLKDFQKYSFLDDRERGIVKF